MLLFLSAAARTAVRARCLKRTRARSTIMAVYPARGRLLCCLAGAERGRVWWETRPGEAIFLLSEHDRQYVSHHFDLPSVRVACGLTWVKYVFLRLDRQQKREQGVIMRGTSVRVAF